MSTRPDKRTPLATKKGSKAKGGEVRRDWLAEFGQKAALDDKALLSVREWIAEQFIGDEYAQLGHAGHGDTRIPLRKVFVDLPMGTHAASSSDRNGETSPFLSEMLTYEPLPLPELRDTSFFDRSDVRNDEMHAISPPKAGDRRKRTPASLMGCGAVGTILIGGPGQGKSTVCQLLCQLHRAALLQGDPRSRTTFVQEVLEPFEKAESERKFAPPAEPLFPVRIVLPDASTWLAKIGAARETSTIPALLDFVASQKSAQKAQCAAVTLAALMSRVPFLLVLDGFDEIGAESDRKRIVSAIRELFSALQKQSAKAVIVATTRPQGYTGELNGLGVPLVTRYLARLTKKEALEYAFKLLDEKIKGIDEREKKKDQLRTATEEPAIARLVETPLQVTILAGLIEKGNVPNERWRLFESYLRTVYDREVGRSLGMSRLLEKRRAQIETIHARAALLLQVEAEATGGASSKMPRERFASIVEQVLQDEGVDEERAELVESIVKVAENRLVFLVEPEPGFFGFEIRSLQEFMAAWALCVDVKESLVEHRIWQIAKAPLFRNVLLFITSKVYSGQSSLRDHVIKVCAKLDEDGSDILAQTMKAGALLALEILEEGAVLSSARFARELMARASGLLDVPASEVPARLVRAVNKDTEKVLIEALEKRITGESFADSVASWGCLNEAANMGHAWAERLAETHWSKVKDPNEILRMCWFASSTPNEWLVAKINQFPGVFDPTWLALNVRFGRQREVKPLPERLRGSVGAVINAIVRRQRSLWGTDVLHILKLASPFDPKTGTTDLHAVRGLSPRWRVWASVVEFDENPSAKQLAVTLSEIAESLPPTEWPPFAYRASWPLQACLLATTRTDELQQFADSAERLLLGDRDDWLAAEERWTRHTTVHEELIAAQQARPFSPESIQVGPPIYCFHRTSRYGFAGPPAHISVADWLVVFEDVSKLDIDGRNATWLVGAVEGYLGAPTNPGWIHLILVHIDTVSSISSTVRSQLAKSLASQTYDTPETRLQVSLLRLWLGDLPESEGNEILRQCSKHLDEDLVALVNIPQLIASSAQSNVVCNQQLREWYSLVRTRLNKVDSVRWVMKHLFDTRRSGLDNLSTWKGLDLPQPYPQKRTAEFARSPIPSQPVILEKLHLQHVRGIQDLSLEFKRPPSGKGQWIVLLGRNGMGKTTLLKALCLALRNLDDPKIWPDKVWSPPWRELGQDEPARIAVRLADSEKELVTTIHNGTQSYRQTPPHDQTRLFPLFAYGCRRGSALGGNAKEVNLDEESGPEIATLFDEGAGLVHAETWLKDWTLRALQDTENAKPIYDSVLAALTKILDVKSIAVEKAEVHIVEKSGRKIPFAAMSDGYLTTAGWFLDLIARWLELCKRAGFNVGSDFLGQMRGLVLIDEIDLHLHPSWQVESIRRTRELLPEMSFVVTTHHPLTLVGAKPEEIFKLKERNGRIVAEQGEARPMLLTSSEILSQYFDVEGVFPSELGGKLQRYGFLSSYSFRNDAEDAEMRALKIELADQGIVPNWEVVERALWPTTNASATSNKSSRRRKSS